MAARLTVAFVAAGTIAGAAWAQAGLQLKLDSSNIRNGTLVFEDFKKAEVPSFGQFKKLKVSQAKFRKATNGGLTSIRGEFGAYVKGADADARYLKQSDPVVRGAGSVFSDTRLVTQENVPVPLIAVPDLITVEALRGKPNYVRIANDSGSPLVHTDCSEGLFGSTAGVVQPGQKFLCLLKDVSRSLQIYTEGGNPKVATLSYSVLPAVQAGGVQFTTQILVGT